MFHFKKLNCSWVAAEYFKENLPKPHQTPSYSVSFQARATNQAKLLWSFFGSKLLPGWMKGCVVFTLRMLLLKSMGAGWMHWRKAALSPQADLQHQEGRREPQHPALPDPPCPLPACAGSTHRALAASALRPDRHLARIMQDQIQSCSLPAAPRYAVPGNDRLYACLHRSVYWFRTNASTVLPCTWAMSFLLCFLIICFSTLEWKWRPLLTFQGRKKEKNIYKRNIIYREYIKYIFHIYMYFCIYMCKE